MFWQSFFFKVGPDIQVLPASLKDVICPDLLKMTSDDITRGGVIPSPNSTKNTKGSKSVSIEKKKIMHSYSVSGNDCEFSVTFFHPSKEKKTIFYLLIFAFIFFNTSTMYYINYYVSYYKICYSTSIFQRTRTDILNGRICYTLWEKGLVMRKRKATSIVYYVV